MWAYSLDEACSGQWQLICFSWWCTHQLITIIISPSHHAPAAPSMHHLLLMLKQEMNVFHTLKVSPNLPQGERETYKKRLWPRETIRTLGKTQKESWLFDWPTNLTSLVSDIRMSIGQEYDGQSPWNSSPKLGEPSAADLTPYSWC